MSDSIVIGSTRNGGALSVDLPRLIDTRMLVQANSGGGKSRLLRRVLEQAFGKVQSVVLDPEGEFATLRERHDFLLVGRGGEVPAEPRAAALLARAPGEALTAEELQARVLGQLPGPEGKLLRALLDAYPEGLPNEELAQRAGYAPNGGAYNNPRGRLRSLGLIDYQGGLVVARPVLFLEE